MAQLAKIEFTIHDVKKEVQSPKKRSNGRNGNRPASAPRHSQSNPLLPTSGNNNQTSSITTTPRKNQTPLPSIDAYSGFQPFPGGATTGNIYDTTTSPINNNNNRTPTAMSSMVRGDTAGNTGVIPDRRLSPEQRTKQQQLNTGNICTMQRINPAKRIPRDEGAFKFSAKPPDRYELLREQDTKIAGYRLRHPEIYEPLIDGPKEPSLRRETCHHNVQARITSRDRTLARSSRKHLNDPLPFYPFLRENEDHGIHKERWNVMTIPSDDPERCRPQTTGTATKSHQDFDKWFHNDKWRSNTLASSGRGFDTMTIEREDLL